MEPDNISYLILFLVIAVASGFAIVFFGVIARMSKPVDPDYEQAKDESLKDESLERAEKIVREQARANFECFKCKSCNYEIKTFNQDFLEIFCLNCGYKEFYHVDHMAGLDRKRDISFRSPPPPKNLTLSQEDMKEIQYYSKDYIATDETFRCERCQLSDTSKFNLKFEATYKFGGYGEIKRYSFTLFSCDKCGYATFFDRPKPSTTQELNRL